MDQTHQRMKRTGEKDKQQRKKNQGEAKKQENEFRYSHEYLTKIGNAFLNIFVTHMTPHNRIRHLKPD